MSTVTSANATYDSNLKQGQTVAFFVSHEIQTKIRERTCKLDEEDAIELIDVLCWCITETWIDLKKGMPLWAVQGARFLSQEHLMSGANTTREQAAKFLEPEAQSLEARYKPRANDPFAQLNDWDMNNPHVQEIVQRCREYNAMGFSSAELDEEQERELAPEKEEERHVEHPSRMEAAQQLVHPDMLRLAKTGKVLATSAAILPAFQALSSTSAASLYDLPDLPRDLLVSKDFMHTIKIPSSSSKEGFVADAFQRPVQWVISVPSDRTLGEVEHLIIISPYEANNLLAVIQETAKVTLHLFSPRTNVSYESLDRLDLWTVGRKFSPETVPRTLTVQLNLFAGSLYLRSYEEYVELCDMLGLLRANAQKGQSALPDGFITTSVGKWRLAKSPVPFFRALLMTIRREGSGLEKTHMGKILNGFRLEEADFRVDIHMTG